MIATQKHWADIEAKYHHHWDPVANKKNAPKPYPTDYHVANFGMDKDINASLKNLKDAESVHGTWNVI